MTETPVKKAAKKRTPAKKKAPARSTPTDQHKAAMAVGREQSRLIRRYLEALKAANAPKPRGRRRTPESINERLAAIDRQLAADPEPLTEVKLAQEQIDLRRELEAFEGPGPDPTEFEDGFVKSVGPYSERQGLTYAAWRQLGVPAIVLRKAKVPR